MYAITETIYACKNCKKYTEDVIDYREGNITCKRCGIILESHVLDTSTDWNTYSRSDSDAYRPSTIIKPSTSLENVLHLDISGSPSKDSTRHLQWYNKTLKNSLDSTLVEGIRKIKQWSSQLNLPFKIIDTAEDLFTKIGSKKGRNLEELAAGALFYALRQHKWPMQLTELTRSLQIPQRKLQKAWNYIRKKTGVEKTMDPVCYAEDFGYDLGLPQSLIKAARELVQKMKEKEILIGKQPATIASVGVFVVCQLSSEVESQRTFEEVARVANLATGTVRDNYVAFLEDRFKEVAPELERKLENMGIEDNGYMLSI